MKKIELFILLLLFIVIVGCESENLDNNFKQNNENVIISEVTESNSNGKVLDIEELVITQGGLIRIHANILNVRSSFSESSEAIGTLQLDELYYYTDIKLDVEGRKWYEIETKDGEIGWIAGWYCEIVVDDNSNSERNNVMILVDVLNVRKDVSTDSAILGKVYKNDLFEVIEKKLDEDDNLWYEVNSEFGVTGWIAGWFTVKVETEKEKYIKANKGELLNISNEYKEVFLDAILLENYSLDSLLKTYGNDYELSDYHSGKQYDYKNGIIIKDNSNENRIDIEVGDYLIQTDKIKKTVIDIFENAGNEIFITHPNGSGIDIFVIDVATHELLANYFEYSTYFMDWEFGEFLNDGEMTLYTSKYKKSEPQKNLYKVIDDEFVKVFDKHMFDEYIDKVNAIISDFDLIINIQIGNISETKKSVLPQTLFVDNKNIIDKSELLLKHIDLKPIFKNNEWYFEVVISVDFILYDHFMGPESIYYSENSRYELNDLARIELLVKLENSKKNIEKIEYKIKYEDMLIDIKPITYSEIEIVNGFTFYMNESDAYRIISDNKASDNEANLNGIGFEYKGVLMKPSFLGELYLEITSKEYKTPRGLKLGNTIEEVEKIYGKPDEGMSGDNVVKYYLYYKDKKILKKDYYSYILIHYENGVVTKYSFNRLILDS